MKDIDILARTGYDRKLMARIRNGHIPEKETVITLGVALGLNIEEMRMFLGYAGYLLSPTIQIDKYYVEIIESVGGKCPDRVDLCNEMLCAKNVEKKYLLGSESRKP